MLFAVALSQGATTVAAVATRGEAVDGPVAMTAAEIRTYNADLDRAHPAYIRCVRTLETGSLVKKRSTCRTNAEWTRTDEVGNDDARDIVEDINRSGSTNRIEPSLTSLIGN